MHNTPLSIQDAANALRQGHVVAIPTQTVYGLAARADQPNAVARVAQLKKRPASKPSPVLIPSLNAAHNLLTTPPTPRVQALAAHFWPGALTLILPHANPSLSPLIRSDKNTIALRQDGHPILQELFQHIDFPITGTSANLSGQPPISLGTHASNVFHNSPHYAGHLGHEPSPMQTPSTIFDTTQPQGRILRPGPISLASILDVYNTTHTPS